MQARRWEGMETGWGGGEVNIGWVEQSGASERVARGNAECYGGCASKRDIKEDMLLSMSQYIGRLQAQLPSRLRYAKNDTLEACRP